MRSNLDSSIQQTYTQEANAKIISFRTITHVLSPRSILEDARHRVLRHRGRVLKVHARGPAPLDVHLRHQPVRQRIRRRPPPRGVVVQVLGPRGHRRDLHLALLVDLERQVEAVVDALLARAALEGRGVKVAVVVVVAGTGAGAATAGRVLVGVEAVRGGLVGARDGVALLEGVEVEDALEEGPGQGEVGGDEGGGGFADVPEGPVGAEGFGEAVELVEDGRDDLHRQC